MLGLLPRLQWLYVNSNLYLKKTMAFISTFNFFILLLIMTNTTASAQQLKTVSYVEGLHPECPDLLGCIV